VTSFAGFSAPLVVARVVGKLTTRLVIFRRVAPRVRHSLLTASVSVARIQAGRTTLPLVTTQSDLPHKVSQIRHDLDDLYELMSQVDQKQTRSAGVLLRHGNRFDECMTASASSLSTCPPR
jgi:hypothetical protein